MKQKMRTWAEVSLGNIDYNIRSIKAALPAGCMVMGIVKANAYGHGAVPVAKAVLEAGAGYLAVACLDEAEELRAAGIEAPILILGITPPEYAKELAALGITQAVGGLEYAKALNDNLMEPLKVHMKLDTGMGRTGFSVREEDAEDILLALGLKNLYYEGVFTHFAVSDVKGDEFTGTQFDRFMRTVSIAERGSAHKFQMKHCANSGAVINYKEFALDMVRPGVITYGMYPARERGGIDLRPALSLKTRIFSVTDHFLGDTVSYGRTFAVERPTRLAVLPIGYADGLHRCLSGKFDVLISGRRCRQVGRICMDMCMVDITNVPGCRPGDVATLIGRDGGEEIFAGELASIAGTINYEITCALTARVPRVYE